ncbi:MAG: hypothetical protein JWM89_3431 [Acidimicrobiales bacterium]|nr:hypothetical protein [Acidimicrobiales bacterium]
MDRPVDFYRDRQMRHDRCGHTCIVDLAWYERYAESAHGCPGCGDNADLGDALRFTGDPADPVLSDGFAAEVMWFHTTTRQDWPTPIDFAATLSDDIRRMMGDADGWALRQSSKALHIGNYESAVHNMLRRMRDQGGKGEQFYLFGVRLRPDVAILPGSMIDPCRNWGDVWLDQIASPEIDVVRYVNVYEDPGGLSAAIRPSAIAATQCLPIPLAVAGDDPWVADIAARLQSVSTELTPLPDDLSEFPYLHRETHRSKAAREIAEVLAAGLPATMEYQFESAVRWEDGDDPAEWARYARSLCALVEDAERVLGEVAAQPVREL